jgi:ectoine hydroxylase-related dioxygenase (phytanoyl-CoA dioxygenase family)
VLDALELEVFERDGIVKVPSAFSADDAARMRGVLWSELRTRHGMQHDDRSTWTNLRPTRLKNTKTNPVANAILGPPLRSALHTLLGEWTVPPHQGQVLVTMPTGETWAVPHRQWHTDLGFELPPDDLVAVKIWALLTDLEPGGGGTPQVAGSHRVIARHLTTTSERDFTTIRDEVLRSDPWFRDLTSADRSTDPMLEADLDGLPVRVVELTGRAGDVYITHPWILHSIATNANDTPRMMRSRFIWRDQKAPTSRAQRTGSSVRPTDSPQSQ